MICPQCATPSATDAAQFCAACGASLTTPAQPTTVWVLPRWTIAQWIQRIAPLLAIFSLFLPWIALSTSLVHGHFSAFHFGLPTILWLLVALTALIQPWTPWGTAPIIHRVTTAFAAASFGFVLAVIFVLLSLAQLVNQFTSGITSFLGSQAAVHPVQVPFGPWLFLLMTLAWTISFFPIKGLDRPMPAKSSPTGRRPSLSTRIPGSSQDTPSE